MHQGRSGVSRNAWRTSVSGVWMSKDGGVSITSVMENRSSRAMATVLSAVGRARLPRNGA